MIRSHRARRARRGLAAGVSSVLVAGFTAVAMHLAAGPAAAQAADPYQWNNVEIVGGGFVPGIVFNETEPDLIYARTDIGGLYRWNESNQRWVPLLDWVGWDWWGWNGVDSVATDPRDPDRVYAAVGMYTNDWDPNPGAILRSTDRGQTWQATELPFKLGGNMPGRGMGERLAIDPNRNSILYFGAPGGNGLWRSTDYGVTWSKVASFPNPGNWSEDPSDPHGYLSHEPGVVWVTFDPRTGSPGNATQTIYVGVADVANTVYRSTDGGATWSRLAGQPTGFLAQKGVLDHVNGYLYIATSDNGGPYLGEDGEVWRYDTATGTWTDITPRPFGNDDPYFGFSGLSVDRQNPDTLMVTGYSSWWPDTWIFRSTDRGDTWTSFYDVPSYPTRVNRYELDISGAPWLTFGSNPQPPEETPKLGWMTQGLAIDPHNSDRMMYGTGATIYGTTNLTAIDSGGTVTIRVMAHGLEETSALALVKPPGGALVSGLGDIGGFRHTSLTEVPAMMHTQPVHGNTTGVDYAELNPSWLVRVGSGEGEPHIAYSNDGGAHWWAGTDPGGVSGGGSVALNADATAVVWSPEGAGVHYSTSVGGSFSPASGVPAGAKVASDRVDPDRFYAYANGTVYVSTDRGRTFTAAATGLPTEGFVSLKAVPGHTGHVWFAGESGLLRSTDGGATFTNVGGSTWAYNVGFGKAAPGRSHPAVYAVATFGGVTGVFRSDDTGATWVRINDDAHQWGNMGAALTGDPDIYGRVYLGTNGRGVLYGDRTGAPPSPPVSPSQSPSPAPSSPSPSSSAEPTPSPSGGQPAACRVTYRVTNEWPGGFQGEVVIHNDATAPISGWTLQWSYTAGQEITQLWNGQYHHDGAQVTVTNASWNGTIAAGGSISVGFLGSWTGSNPVPTSFTLNGLACTAS